MEFTLTYDGPLTASGSKAALKQRVRSQLHPQIQALWDIEPLKSKREAVDPAATGNGAGVLLSSVGDCQFACLISDAYRLRAQLQITLLRPEEPGSLLVRGGDIDNRLKTLLDALRRPQTDQEMPPGWTPSVSEHPFFCLLDDDRLVTGIAVDTDRLLASSQPDHVRLLIKVSVRAVAPTWWSVAVI